MRKTSGRKNGGFVMVWALLLMVVLLLLGISGIGTSVFDSLMTANDALHKQSFSQADGGTALGESLVYDNEICSVTSGGFSKNILATSGYVQVGDDVIVQNLSFSQNPQLPVAAPVILGPPAVADNNRDLAYYPTGTFSGVAGLVPLVDQVAPNANDLLPHTNLLYQSRTIAGPGSGAGFVMGYLGLGQANISGSNVLFEINSQSIGTRNSQSIVTAQWKVSLGVINAASPSDCKY